MTRRTKVRPRFRGAAHDVASYWLGLEARSQGPPFHLRKPRSPTSIARSERADHAVALVQAYVDRAKAYNGVSNQLVTADGAPIPPAPGAVRAGAPLEVPDRDRRIDDAASRASIEYAGPPIEFGRMEPTASDPERPAAVRHDRRHAERRPGQRARRRSTSAASDR